MQPSDPVTTKRRGARRMSAVPESVRSALATGAIETANLMEWLAADMCALAVNVASETRSALLRKSLANAVLQMRDASILNRLRIAGDAIARSLTDLESAAFLDLAHHRSDLVRQWACYAANSMDFSLSSEERLEWTLRFAADKNMSVREAAWMAYRPHLQRELPASLRRLERVCASTDANLRRFSVEVCRPRSVWGAHIRELKREPGFALPLIEAVRADESRYVQLAAGNWLNDASKTRPDWVTQLCSRWREDGRSFSPTIVKRGLRSLGRPEGLFSSHPELPLSAAEFSQEVLQGAEP
jgi:3-methyladenine DNA glycosylase AlkC